ncbi:MAG: LptF/LptG family permease [Planctomycetota bacterium]
MLKFLIVDVLWRVIQALIWIISRIVYLPVRILFFRRTTDMYIGTSFVMPLITVIVCIAGLVTAFDVIDHLSEITDGIRLSAEPLGALPIRTQTEAIRDVIALYSIQALDFTLEYLPLWVLVAGLMCAMVLVRNQEHLILKSSGIRLQRAMRPAIILALLACGSVTLIRELYMPELILHRDFLKPQVYHKNSQPSSLALYVVDENKKPILFEMGSYNFASRQGKDLHIYFLGEEKNGRIPQLVADVAIWDNARQGFNLFMDPVEREMALLKLAASGPFGGGKDKTTDKEKEGKNKAPVAAKSTALIPGGQRRDTDTAIDMAAIGGKNAASLPLTATRITRVDFWQGPMNPKYIDSERLGVKVMRLDELKKNSEYKPELMAEWYRRVSEFAMGFILLWCALPLMLSDSTHSPVTSIAFSTLLAAVYWIMCMACAKLGADGASFTLFAYVIKFPIWAPIIPHCFFFIVGFIQFYFRLET